MEDAKYYPKFLYPNVVIGDNYKICYPDLPEKPKKPIAVENNGKGFFSTSVFLAAIMFLIMLAVPDPDFTGFGFFTVITLLIYKIYTYSNDNKYYQEAIKKYELEYAKFEKEEKEYNEILSLRNKIREYIDKEEEDVAKVLTLKELYSRKNVQILDLDECKEGVSEKTFYPYLVKCFGNRIKRGKKVITKDSDSSYYPDFIYYDNVRQIFLDIEIDEPYDLMTGDPIHCLNHDYIRDKFFLDINWCVIRFSEAQIIQEPENCIKTLESIINILEYGLLKWTSFVKKDMCWDKEKATVMAENGFREKYLGITKVKRETESNKAEDEDNDEGEGKVGGYFPSP